MKTDAHRFWEKVDAPLPDSACWPWNAAINRYGYGTFRWGGRKVHAMRVAYELERGPVPDGMEIDHLCHTNDATCVGGAGCPHRACVNPGHLETVTREENYRRGRGVTYLADKTHCLRGHPFDGENTLVSSGRRYCRTCMRIREARRSRRAK